MNLVFISRAAKRYPQILTPPGKSLKNLVASERFTRHVLLLSVIKQMIIIINITFLGALLLRISLLVSRTDSPSSYHMPPDIHLLLPLLEENCSNKIQEKDTKTWSYKRFTYHMLILSPQTNGTRPFDKIFTGVFLLPMALWTDYLSSWHTPFATHHLPLIFAQHLERNGSQ